MAIRDVGKRTSRMSHRSAARVPASAEATAGITSRWSLRGTLSDVVGRSDEMASNDVIGPNLAPMGSNVNDRTSGEGSVSAQTVHTMRRPTIALPVLRERVASVPTGRG